LQFPWRLLGPLCICLAVGAAGALAEPLAWIERRAGRLASAGVVALLCAGALFNGVGDRGFQLAPQPARQIDGRAVLADERNDFLGLGTTSGREFLPRDVRIATYTAGQPRGWPVFERLYPEADWLDGLLLPMGGDLRILGWEAKPLRIVVRVANDGATPGLLGMHQARFPGWRLWIDGRPTPVGAAPEIPEQQATPGFMTADVPPGEHTLVLAFGPTRLRLLGMVVSAITIFGAAWALLIRQGAQRRWPFGVPLAGGLLVAAVLGYATWRGVRPLAGWYVASAPALPAPDRGVWRDPAPNYGGSRLLVNVAEAVRGGTAQVESPTGTALGPGQFVDVRQLTVTDADAARGAAGTSRREWLFLHPPSSVAVDVALPPGAKVWFQAALSLDPQMWTAPTGDGVRYQVLVSPVGTNALDGASAAHTSGATDAAGSSGTVVVDRQINPRADADTRRWVPVEADLSPWAGTTVRVTLRTTPREDLTYDWSGWGNPVIEVLESARGRR
jgi:hypothetical protein